MVASNGRSVVVEVNTVDVGAQLRVVGLTHNFEPVDVTTMGDDAWMTTLDGVHNTKSIVINLEGVEKDTTFSNLSASGAHAACVVTNAALETYTGNFQFTQYSSNAPYNGEKTFSVTMSSTGPITIAEVV